MAVKWTPEQREAIEYSGKNILLAAAAGSGKTAVLVQRIIELICRKDDPVNINELLVLTYTDAAAKEMREKISDAVEKALEENPEDEHLQRQRLLIHSASISTIHSFCLNVLKNNIHMTTLPVNFSLISETENKMMIAESLDRVLERFYGQMGRDSSVANLVMGYGGIKNDNTLRETVLSLFHFSKSMAYPAKWLNSAVREFKDVAQTRTIKGTVWLKWLKRKTDQSFFELVDIYRDIESEIDTKLGTQHRYSSFFAEEEASIRRVFDHMDMGDYTSVREALLSFKFATLPTGVKGATGETLASQEKVKALRTLAKSVISDLWEFYKIPEDEMISRITELYPILRTLKNIVLITDRSYTKQKRGKNYLDFSDLEHEVLKLLDSNDGQNSITESLRSKYKEILIDEYQDTNHIQDTIFRTVSRDNNNIFMVGDLKQSIYAFRNAVPKLFADKYFEYGEQDGRGHLIRLFKNFRSRSQVVDTVNFIFRSVMNPEVGDVDYTEEEYLVQGAPYPNTDDGKNFIPEFHFACSNSEVAEGDEELSRQEIEAYISAGRIREMIDSGMEIFDKNLQKMRPVEYRDIVVLMRNTKTTAPIFEQIFEESSIPVYTEVGKSYLNSREVQTVLSFLQIIDNPRQDIPLIAVMRSPIWGFTAEELAQIRAAMRTGCFFDAVIFAAENGDTKAKGFLTELEKLRQRAETEGTERLIWRIYYEYGYFAYSGAQSHGAMRQANLRLLFERAAEFEHTALSGLFSFMNYIETIRSQGDDLTPAKALGEGDNVVRIMTIHKSKGLEFPVVVLADTAHEFNMMDLNKNIIWNNEVGLGCDFVDTKIRVRYPTLPRNIVVAKSKSELFSEEMRLLYVALTRAREKLIVTSTFKQTKSGPGLPLYDSEKRVKGAYVRSKRCFRDWMLAAIATHPDAENLREYFGFEGLVPVADSDFGIRTFIYENQSDIPRSCCEAKEVLDTAAQKSVGVDEEIRNRLEYVYKNSNLGKIPTKLSVSEVKRMQAESDEHIPLLEELKVSGINPLERVTGAMRGTVVHFVMQSMEPQKIKTHQDVKDLIARLTREKIITSAQAEAVDTKKIFAFFESEMGRRLKNSKRLEREFSFYTKAKIDEIYKNGIDGDILLQGTMDCFFEEEDGKVVLLDFKTDRAKTLDDAKRISQKYKVQMKYYKQALREILEKDVDECYLYFLDCGEMIEM
ncbi:MAG: helicase-exonuclease AddAB subunit AddA [Clostridia bacterium]|nr:helicase-exonuclease AddAB subunit AddA [Clostridia bacterium]